MAIARPEKKAISVTPYAGLRRILPAWVTPTMEAERWRRVVRHQPVAMVCRDRLISYVQSLQYEIRSKRAKDEDKYAHEIEHYSRLLDNAAGMGFDWLLDVTLQDALDLPVGGNIEIVRWSPGKSPLKNPHPDGHVAELVHIDGATLTPTFSPTQPMMQIVGTNRVFFSKRQIGRILFTPRPGMESHGLGMAPPERIYLALNLLYHGDRYYANLLMDIPEAGILDLGDMSRDSAETWLKGLRTLLTGDDPFKVPVLYEHETPARFVSFGRPPTELLFDTTTEKYARLTAAGYWLTLSDVGLESDSTLAGQIRRERAARLTGFGVVKEKVKNLINRILPPYLEFQWVEKDEEAMVARGKAALVMTQAISKMVESGLISPAEGQKMLKKDGVITIDVEEPTTPPPGMPALPGGDMAAETSNIVDKVPADQGGLGDIIPTVTKSFGSPTNDKTYHELDELAAPMLAWYYSGAGESVGKHVFAADESLKIKMAAFKRIAELSGVGVDRVAMLSAGIDAGEINIAGENIDSGDDREISRFLYAVWAFTHDQLRRNGVEKAVVYRAFPAADGVLLNMPIGIDVSGVDMWTLDSSVAVLAAVESDGIVVSMVISTGRIVSTGRTGYGVLNDGSVYIDASDGDMGTCYFVAKLMESDNGNFG